MEQHFAKLEEDFRLLSIEQRLTLSTYILKTFINWHLDLRIINQLLNQSLTEESLEKIEQEPVDILTEAKVYYRIRLLSRINRNLINIYSRNRYVRETWMTTTNHYFDGQKPIDLILKDDEKGIEKIFQYLESYVNKEQDK